VNITKRKRWLLAALAMVVLIGAGCSSGVAENGNAGNAGTAGSGGDKNATNGSKTVRFAACMRDNGVSEFPDPNASDDQELVDGMRRALDANPAAWKKAISACKDLRPPGLLGGKATTQEMRQRLAFAQCVRDNGVKDFPDPTRDGPLVDTNRIPSSAANGGMTILNAAMEHCGDALAGARGGR
jgi:hypothetical protein